VLEQRSVRNLFVFVVDLCLQVFRVQGEHRHGLIITTASRACPLNKDAAAQEGVEFLLVGNMSLEVYLARVALLLARPLHQTSLRD
jgi:hypothetical protein